MRLDARETLKTAFHISLADRSTCRTLGGTVRYMVMDRAPMSLYQALNQSGPLSLRLAVTVMIDLIAKLQRMHSLGIVHGDLHSGNVVVMHKGGWDVGFIDFGMSFFMDEIRLERVRNPFDIVHCFLSPWELRGFMPSMRDDVFNALFLGAVMMHGAALLYRCEALEENPVELLYLKAHEFFFTLPGLPLDFESVEKGLEIVDRLDRALSVARNVPTTQTKPDYEEILTNLTEILLIIQD
jgi:serine/threonine protein kinase